MNCVTVVELQQFNFIEVLLLIKLRSISFYSWFMEISLIIVYLYLHSVCVAFTNICFCQTENAFIKFSLHQISKRSAVEMYFREKLILVNCVP